MSDQNGSEDGHKTVLRSKTIHFNIISGVLVQAAYPFLPEHIRTQPWLIPFVTAWFSIANIILRFVTKEALHFRRGRDESKEEST